MAQQSRTILDVFQSVFQGYRTDENFEEEIFARFRKVNALAQFNEYIHHDNLRKIYLEAIVIKFFQFSSNFRKLTKSIHFILNSIHFPVVILYQDRTTQPQTVFYNNLKILNQKFRIQDLVQLVYRALQKPLLIHDAMCKLSIFVWVRDPSTFDILFYDEPVINLLFSPIYECKKRIQKIEPKKKFNGLNDFSNQDNDDIDIRIYKKDTKSIDLSDIGILICDGIKEQTLIMPCLAKLNNHHGHYSTNPVVSPRENIVLISPQINNNFAKFSSKNTFMFGDIILPISPRNAIQEVISHEASPIPQKKNQLNKSRVGSIQPIEQIDGQPIKSPPLLLKLNKLNLMPMDNELSSPSQVNKSNIKETYSKKNSKNEQDLKKIKSKFKNNNLLSVPGRSNNVGLYSPTRIKLLHNKSIDMKSAVNSDKSASQSAKSDKDEDEVSIFTSSASFSSATSFNQSSEDLQQNLNTITNLSANKPNWREKLQQKIAKKPSEIKEEQLKSKEEEFNDNLKKEVLQYYSDRRGALPAYYYFKQRNKNVINFVMKSVQQKNYNIKGDVNQYFKTLPAVTSAEEQLQIFSEINHLFRRNQFAKEELITKDTIQRQKERQAAYSQGSVRNKVDTGLGRTIKQQDEDQRGYYKLSNNQQNYCFEMQLANKLRMQKFSIDEFLQQNNFFNKSDEEIGMIYQALKDPDTNQMYLDSLGLTDVDILYRKWLKRQRKIKRFQGKEGLENFVSTVIDEENQMIKTRNDLETIRQLIKDKKLSSKEDTEVIDYAHLVLELEPQIQLTKNSAEKRKSSVSAAAEGVAQTQRNQFNTEQKSSKRKKLHELLKDLGTGAMERQSSMQNTERQSSTMHLNKKRVQGSSFLPSGQTTPQNLGQQTHQMSTFLKRMTLMNNVRKHTMTAGSMTSRNNNNLGETNSFGLAVSQISQNYGLRRQGIVLQRKLQMTQKLINDASKNFLMPINVINKKKINKGQFVTLFPSEHEKEYEKLKNLTINFYTTKQNQIDLIQWTVKQNTSILD
ncbi:UNKNOWN [Stylonychia lemnae]|uniref:Uncharacterized protein n=1 Tax=Stylonychia lemnae TaxID=5949 RepID=A0A078A0V3_STYLE|nr:UNKNOWN [Stylonychia lemnae]|eukprot:CDW74419.1 UNKNOWN [Stylonychia lemnae]